MVENVIFWLVAKAQIILVARSLVKQLKLEVEI